MFPEQRSVYANATLASSKSPYFLIFHPGAAHIYARSLNFYSPENGSEMRLAATAGQ